MRRSARVRTAAFRRRLLRARAQPAPTDGRPWALPFAHPTPGSGASITCRTGARKNLAPGTRARRRCRGRAWAPGRTQPRDSVVLDARDGGGAREADHRHRSRDDERLRRARSQPDPEGRPDGPRQPHPADGRGALRQGRRPRRRGREGSARHEPEEHHLRREASHRPQVELEGRAGAAQLLLVRHRRGAGGRGGGDARRQGPHAARDQRDGPRARQEDRRGVPAEADRRGDHLGAGLLLRRAAARGPAGRPSRRASR